MSYSAMPPGAGGRCLRANGKYLPWNNGVSVDSIDNFSTMMHWVMEHIPAGENIPRLPRQTGLPLPDQMVAVAGDPVRAGCRRRDPLRPRTVRVQGEVRIPPEERAGQAAGCRRGRPQPRHVLPHT
ncbi:uncharacterized protein [Triticum aestivum]|uniref:uncharacterized protein n=1 Tax=Triticum aestivum TaxID=4565 RepID=UPI001D0274F7|nr:uncharacterized protein LOC123154253 [Triticum aestivum]